MKEKFFKRKWLRTLAAVCMSMLLLMGVVQAAFASENSAGGRETGSLSLTLAVTEDGQQVPLTNVPLALYQVGTMDTDPVSYFHMTSSLSGTGVDLNNLKTAADVEKASALLANAVGSAGIVPLTGTTDGNGNLSFSSLPKGVYLLVQTGATDSCKVSPMLISVPYTSDGTTFDYDVQAFPKAEKTDKYKKGELTVTKKLSVIDPVTMDFVDICAPNATYYVRLFLDESATIPYGDVQAIHIQGQSSGSVSYSDLPSGTYYLRETDAQGNPRPLDSSFTDDTGVEVNCTIQVNGNDTTGIVFDASADHFDTQEAVVDNIYVKIPDGYYLDRELWIEKKVLKDGSQTTTDETFYATVVEVDPDTGEETKIETIDLIQNGKVQVTLPPISELEDADTVYRYRVYESDADGNAVDKNTFGYEVSGEGNIEFAGNEDGDKTITITNTVVTTTPGGSASVTPGGAQSHGGTSSTTKNAKTGDNTPIVMWLVVLLAAAIVVGFVIGRRRKK